MMSVANIFGKRTRRKANGELPVVVLANMLEQFMEESRTRDLARLFASASKVYHANTGKCSPTRYIEAIVDLHPLLCHVFDLSPNGMLPRIRLELAIESCHKPQEDKAVIFTTRDVKFFLQPSAVRFSVPFVGKCMTSRHNTTFTASS